jgi:hypothetical protein
MTIKKNVFQLFTASVLICFLINQNANAQAVPNGSFENWTLQNIGALNVLTADNWVGSYTQGSNPLSPKQTTDHVDGSYGIELETTQWPIVGKTGAVVACTFPMNTKPLYLNGFFKSTRVDTTGTGQVFIRFMNNGTIIGSGLFKTNTSVNVYTPFSQLITYTSNLVPDEATIWLCSEGIFGVNTKNFGNKLWIDKLSLSTEPTSISNTMVQDDYFTIFPNPTNSIVNIILKNNSEASLSVKNILGQKVLTELLNKPSNTINIDHLQNGVYLFELQIADKIFIQKIIKE